MLTAALGWEQEAAQERIKLGFISRQVDTISRPKRRYSPYKWALFVIQADTDSGTKRLRQQ